MARKLRLYNSLTKEVEDFTALNRNRVTVYHCGPTVYKRQHIGNMRRFLFADFLGRTLDFLGYPVVEITNITDVGHLTQEEIDGGEDKLAVAAKKQNLTPHDIAERESKMFFADIEMLNIRKSSEYPKATDHIQNMIDIISELIDKERAYVTETGVYYSVESFQEYGILSGNTLDEIEAGKRIDVREEKRHPADFALWILSDDALQKWSSPWGTGYPGWHIECSAMSMKYLGSTIDIHTGGEDNKFPHHENEIAQSEGVTGEKFVNFWAHNAHLRLGGNKLAKSKGKQITLDTLVEKGYSPLAFRLLVFGSHYRTPMEYSWALLDSAEENLKTLRGLLNRLKDVASTTNEPSEAIDDEVIDKFMDALADDLNTPRALAVLMNYTKDLNLMLSSEADDTISAEARKALSTLLEMDQVIGLIEILLTQVESVTVPEKVMMLVNEREEARRANDYDKSDVLRDKIEEEGYQVEDTDEGPRVIPK